MSTAPRKKSLKEKLLAPLQLHRRNRSTSPGQESVISSPSIALLRRVQSGHASSDASVNIVASLSSAPPSTNSMIDPETWWSRHRVEIVSSVRQVLEVTEKALDGVPAPGVKGAVGGLSAILKIFQVCTSELLLSFSIEARHDCSSVGKVG
jgi:hypothetical protein